MSKILLKINKDEELTYPADGYVLGIKDFSYLFGKTYTIDEIINIKNNTDKEIYVSFNKLIFNNELENYKKLLHEVDKIGVKGIFIGDIAALTYNLNTNIILDQMHLNNSYFTINHYQNDIYGMMLTNDITKDEINEISNNTNIKLYKQVFGYPHLSTSKRKLITNYLKHFNINNNETYYKIKENDSSNYYHIFEDEFGTHILGDKPLNLLGIDINVDYKVIDGLLIDDIKEVLDIYINNEINNKEYIDNKYNSDTGFINKETIYRVKDDEK